MAYDFLKLKTEITGTERWLQQELTTLRTGRATPILLDGISVEVYGSRMKLSQIATVTVEDARSLYIAPWDKEQLKPIEKAITLADLGVGVGSDDKGVRVSFPELTTERRVQLIKLVKGKLEDARVALRGERTKTMEEIEGSEMGEDDIRRTKDDAQKLIEAGNLKLEELATKKEKELSE